MEKDESPILRSGNHIIIDEFDGADPKNLGRPRFFRLDLFVAVVESLIASDEIERAFWMLDNPPAWWRENYPKELQDIKDTLYKNMYDSYDYAADPDEAGWTKENAESQFGTAYTYPRAEILEALVKENPNPWVCELSTSHGLLPLGLKKRGLEFSFFAKNLNHAALVKVKEWLGDTWCDKPKENQKKIFVFCESLEHAYRQEDLKQSYKKLGIDFDFILLSVPYGTLGGGLSNWDTRRIGHIRAYTKKDLETIAQEFFPGFEWICYKSASLCLLGRKKT